MVHMCAGHGKSAIVTPGFKEILKKWLVSLNITCKLKIVPLTSHFYIVKQGFTWVYILYGYTAKRRDEKIEKTMNAEHNSKTFSQLVKAQWKSSSNESTVSL